MRILMLSWEYPPHTVGGMGKHVMELAPALAAEGLEVHILTPLLRGGAAYEHTPEDVHIHRVDPFHQGDGDFVALTQHTGQLMERAAHALRARVGGFDLVHGHDWLVASVGVGLKHAWRRPLIATIHATERGRGRGVLGSSHALAIHNTEWQLIYEAWRVIACSNFMAHQIADYFHAPSDKIDVIPNGIYMRPDTFVSEEARRAFRRRFAPDQAPLVFSVGRIVYEKGMHVLVEAWPAVLAARPDARLVIAGTGDCLDELKRQAAGLGLSDSITFAGFIADSDRDWLYRVADVAVFPSLYEPFGIVALEAMAARCPVVVAETGGLAEVVIPHETGLTVQPNTPAALAWGLIHTLDRPDWARARAENAQRVVRETFNWRRIAAATAEVYERTYAAWQQVGWGVERAVGQV